MNLKIGLIDVDGHHFPNLCLMKLSAYHKARGDPKLYARAYQFAVGRISGYCD